MQYEVVNDVEDVKSEKSFKFAVSIVNAVRVIKERTREWELCNQLLRSGTSIGSNIAEANYAQSDKDFLSKLKIALKEANETKYWLRLMRATEMINDEEAKNLITDADELMRILTSVINTKETNMKR